MPTFYDYMSQNMKEMGLDAPHELFGSIKQAKDVITAIAAAIATKRMANMTMGQLAGAVGEVALPIGENAVIKLALKRICTTYAAVTASYYLGACVGSAGVAAWKIAWPGQKIPAVQHLTDADIHRILTEHQMQVDHDLKFQMLTELHRHNTPNTAFGRTTQGSR